MFYDPVLPCFVGCVPYSLLESYDLAKCTTESAKRRQKELKDAIRRLK